MLGPGYVWFVLGWWGKKWWEEPDELVHCTLEEMQRAARMSYYISTESLQLSPSPDVTVGNIVSKLLL